MNEWRYWLTEQRATLMAVGIFAVMFLIYVANHPAGFNANVVQTAANKGVLLAFVAMAQTLVVITAGIDLSVGMIFILTNCLASWLVVGTALETTFGVIAVLGTGLACGALNGAHNFVVAGTPAEVAREPEADAVLVRVRFRIEQRLGGHDEAWSANAALERGFFQKGLL